jgi:uncharacterized membrane-anchored protein
MAGSDIPVSLPVDKVVIVYDNEPKSDTVQKIAKAIDKGYRVCIWPDNIDQKDINDMVLFGYKPESIRGLIDSNLYTGLEAKAKLQHWSNPHGHSKGIEKGNDLIDRHTNQF